MKKQLRGNCVHRQFDNRHRRLMFERCEERLALSGSSVVPVDAAALEGGFISLDAGDFISPPANYFLAADSLESLSRFNLSAAPTIFQFNSDPDAWTLSNSFETPRLSVLDTLHSVYPEIEIGTTVAVVVDGGLIFGQLDFRSVLDVDTSRTTSSTELVDGLSIRSFGVEWDDGASVVNSDEIIPPPVANTGEKPLTDAVANGESQSILVDAVGDGLRFEPHDTLAVQSIPQGELAYPLSERPDHLFTKFQDYLQPSETTLAATILKGAALKETTYADLSTREGPSVVVVDESQPTTESVEVGDATKRPRESVAVVDDPDEVPQDDAHGLPVRSVPLVIGGDGDRIELPSRKGDDAFAYSAEGGPIEVAQAVVDTQQAFEAQVFSAVAALLDEQNILAQPTPPVRRPFSGELARSVAFETVGLEPTADSAHFNDSHAPSVALPASSVGAAISASAAAADVEEADTGPSRALAFAQWPLVFSATMGAFFVGSRRRSQSRAAQLPPRRNR